MMGREIVSACQRSLLLTPQSSWLIMHFGSR